jgi:DNA-binding transcriptional MerR regulator
MRNVVEIFTAGDVVKLTGITYPVLDYWVRTDFIVPTKQNGTGKGSDRLFSFGDVVAIKTALRLRRLGASLQGLREAVRHIQKQHKGLRSTAARTLAGKYLVWDGHELFEKNSGDVIAMLKRPDQFAFDWVLNLKSVSTEKPQTKKSMQKARFSENQVGRAAPPPSRARTGSCK